MNELHLTFSVLFISIIGFTNLTHAIIGGIISSLIGWFGKSDEIRWAASYALIGIICSCIYERYAGSYELMVHTQLNIFVPLFAAIGLVWSGIFRYRVKDIDWRILALFPVVGIMAAVVYQVRSTVMLFAGLGMIAGGIIWYLTGSRLRSTFAFAGMGTILALNLLPLGYSWAHIQVIVGGLFGGIVGWSIQNRTVKWIFALGMLGAFAESIVHYFTVYSDGLLPILFGGVVGGIGGIVIHGYRQRTMITFILLGAVFFCFIKFGWDMLQPLLFMSRNYL